MYIYTNYILDEFLTENKSFNVFFKFYTENAFNCLQKTVYYTVGPWADAMAQTNLSQLKKLPWQNHWKKSKWKYSLSLKSEVLSASKLHRICLWICRVELAAASVNNYLKYFFIQCLYVTQVVSVELFLTFRKGGFCQFFKPMHARKSPPAPGSLRLTLVAFALW